MDDPGKLRLTFIDYDDGTGMITASASSNGFAGEADAWLNVEELRRFADEVAEFPLPEGARPVLACGYGRLDGAGNVVLDEEIIAVEVYAIDGLGHFGVQVRLASDPWGGRPETRHATQLELVISYGGLARFSRALRALLAGRAEEAVLAGEY